jgi:hypothetical protein
VAPAFLKVFQLVEQVPRRLASKPRVINIGACAALLAMAGSTGSGSFCHVVFERFALGNRILSTQKKKGC